MNPVEQLSEAGQRARARFVEALPYLVFYSRFVMSRYPQSSSHAMIIYAYTAEDAHAQWKARYSEDLIRPVNDHGGRVSFGYLRPPVGLEQRWIERADELRGNRAACADGMLINFVPCEEPRISFGEVWS